MLQEQTGVSANAFAWSDRWGIYASVLCVIHCVLTPFLVSFSAVFAHLLPGEEKTHRTLAVAVACFGATAVLTGYRRHRRSRVLALVSLGLGCIGAAAWFGDRLPTHAWEMAVTLVGSCLMIAGHRMNHSFCGACPCATSK